MHKFIQITDSVSGWPVYVSISKIITIRKPLASLSTECTLLEFGADEFAVYAKESPEQIIEIIRRAES